MYILATNEGDSEYFTLKMEEMCWTETSVFKNHMALSEYSSLLPP
jgi:hypothetical protein